MARYEHRSKRVALAAYDLLAAFACAIPLSLAYAPCAYAYVDPSVITYTIQALAGVAVALSAVAGVAFRRTRKALVKTLHIDENANKETESEVHRLDGQGKPIYAEGNSMERGASGDDSQARRSATQHPAKGPGTRKMRWPSRLWRAALAMVLLVGTLCIATPIEMVAASASSLVFGVSDIWQPIMTNALIAIVTGTLILSLFRGVAFDTLMMLAIAAGICFYVQALFLNQTLPAANGSPLFLGEHFETVIISGIVWLMIFVIGIVLLVKWRPIGRGVGTFICAALIIMQGVGVASLLVSPATGQQDAAQLALESLPEDERPSVITQEGLYEVSPSNNVVVFVLDAFDVINMNAILRTNPEAAEELTGFTYFKNSTGSSVPTRYGIPFLLTGSWPKANETWQHYVENRYTSTTLSDDVLAGGYSLYVYTDTPGPGGIQYLSSRASNIHPLNETEIHVETKFNLNATVAMLYKMALYRDMPWVLKKPFWFYTEEVNQAAVDVETYETSTVDAERRGSDSPYVLDDVAYYNRLRNLKLSIYDDGAKGSLHFIHLFGAHQPYTMNENAIRINKAIAVEDQCRGSLLIVSEYLRQMKELGVYDDATIIITADHGYWNWDDTIEQSEADGDMAGGPIMLVKPSGTAEQSAQPLVVSDVRTGHIDYPATIIDAIGGDTSKYGLTVFEANDPNRIRHYYWPTHDGTRDLTIYEYAIDGEVDDWASWSRTGVSWVYDGLAGAIIQ